VSTDVEIEYSNKDRKRKVEINIPDLKNEFAILSILNISGEHIIKMKLSGTSHEIDLSFLKNEEVDLKIETSSSVTLKRIK
jgi:hypothetical protein